MPFIQEVTSSQTGKDNNSIMKCKEPIANTSQLSEKVFGTRPSIYSNTGTDISTSPLAPASEYLKKEPSGKHILVCTCPNG